MLIQLLVIDDHRCLSMHMDRYQAESSLFLVFHHQEKKKKKNSTKMKTKEKQTFVDVPFACICLDRIADNQFAYRIFESLNYHSVVNSSLSFIQTIHPNSRVVIGSNSNRQKRLFVFDLWLFRIMMFTNNCFTFAPICTAA